MLDLISMFAAVAMLPATPHGLPTSHEKLVTPPPFGRNAAQEAAALRWIERDGHPLSGADAGPNELEPIVARLRGARVIGIGEATHGDHEDQLFKVNMLRALIRDGAITAVAMELNRPATRALDRYVRFGEGDPATLIRSNGFYRVWRGEEFASFLIWLRAWNQKAEKPIRIFGIDNQEARRDVPFALAMVARHDPALAATLRAPFGTLVPKEGEDFVGAYFWVHDNDAATVARAMAAARALADAIGMHKAAWADDPDYAEARYAAETAWQNLNELELETKGSVFGTKRPAEYESRRDRFMAANLVTLAGSDERVALWAHNGHLQHSAPSDAQEINLGFALRELLGNGYRCLGFTWSRGSIATIVSPLANATSKSVESDLALRNDQPDGLGSIFARTKSDALWIDLTARPHTPLLDGWAGQSYWMGHAGAVVDPARWHIAEEADTRGKVDQMFDILVWFRSITPARRISQ